MMKAGFDQEVNAKKAEAELAYTLQAAKEKQAIREQQIEVRSYDGQNLFGFNQFYPSMKFYLILTQVSRGGGDQLVPDTI